MEISIDLFKSQVTPILSIQEMLLNLDNADNSVEKIIEFVDKMPIFTQDQNFFQSFLQSISSSIISRPLFEKQYVQILQHYLTLIPKKYIFMFLSKSNMALSLFLDHNLIDIDDIEKNCNSINHNSLIYFKDYIKTRKSSSLLNELITKNDATKEKENQIAQIIREDDLDSFQRIVNETVFKFNSKVPWSIFECMFFLNEKEMPTYAEYACFFGSVRIFKFLVLNGALKTTDSTRQTTANEDPETSQKYLNRLGEFAVNGGSYEIIHILEDNGVKFTEKSLLNSIESQRNEIASYLTETVGIQPKFDDIIMSIKSNNLSYFIDNFVNLINSNKNEVKSNVEKIWLIAAEFGRIEIIKFLINSGIEFNKNVTSESGQNILHVIISNGFLNIVEFLINQNIIDMKNRDEFVFI